MITGFRERAISYAVAPALCMLTAVDLDDKPFLAANKINDLRSDCFLTRI
jgi:hypothetical protein